MNSVAIRNSQLLTNTIIAFVENLNNEINED